MPIPLVVTKRYEGQWITSWSQRATQTNRDPNRDKTLARSNQLRTSETYRRQDDVFGYKLQFLLSGVLLVFCNLNYTLQRRLSEFSINTICSWRVIQRQVMRHFTSNGTGQCQNGSSNLLTPYRERPRWTRVVVAYPRPAFSAPKRTTHAPVSFDEQP